MVKSMTGYGKAQISENGLNITCEIKALNGRNLELNAKLPRLVSPKEFEIKDIVKELISRGSLSLYLNVEKEKVSSDFDLNKDLAQDVLDKINELKKNLKFKDAIKFQDIMQYSNYFIQKQDDSYNLDDNWKHFVKCIKESVKELDNMRRKEGSNIQKDIEKRAKNIQDILKKIEVFSATRVQTEVEKLRQRIALLLDNDDLDDYRLNMEVALIADKLDIAEECVRLHSHIKHFFEILKENNPVGTKLNFLLQEMNREVNTIGSKANDSQIAHLVVSAKEEIERIREQSQNIE